MIAKPYTGNWAKLRHGFAIRRQIRRGSTLGRNVPKFVDIATGGYGGTIQDALNSAQTPTMANFATLANVLAGAVMQVTSDSTTKTRGSNSLMPLAGTCASASRAKRVGQTRTGLFC